jgi:hypothetical protein
MASSEYGRIRVLAEKLAAAKIAPEATTQILAGADAIRATTSPEHKAAWMNAAMRRMDDLLNEPTRHAVREACACCLGGKRLEMSKSIAKSHSSLEERVRAANAARLVFGHSVSLSDDGRVLVQFGPNGLDHYRCPCLPKAAEPMPITYCYCCGGHVKHHLQIALGRRLAVTVQTTALSSGGKTTCSFAFDFVD